MGEVDPMSVCSAVTNLSFTTMSSEEILRQSVMEITEVNTFDLMGHPTRGGLYDGRMGEPRKFQTRNLDCGEKFHRGGFAVTHGRHSIFRVRYFRRRSGEG